MQFDNRHFASNTICCVGDATSFIHISCWWVRVSIMSKCRLQSPRPMVSVLILNESLARLPSTRKYDFMYLLALAQLRIKYVIIMRCFNRHQCIPRSKRWNATFIKRRFLDASLTRSPHSSRVERFICTRLTRKKEKRVELDGQHIINITHAFKAFLFFALE